MSDEIVERVADEVHQVWCMWMEYMFKQGTHKQTTHAVFGKYSPEKVWVMPEDKLERWTRQMKTDYQDLSEEEKESDREIAQKYLDIVLRENVKKDLEKLEKLRAELMKDYQVE